MKKELLPYPLSKRICKCGCGIEFQPRRRDNIYLNKQHADFAYNHGKRKKRDPNSAEINKIIRKNDAILRSYYVDPEIREHLPEFSTLQKAGFNSGCYTGVSTHETLKYYRMYNFIFAPIKENNTVFIKIEKYESPV